MNNTYTLKNNYLEATFKNIGAELISLKSSEIEFIWQGNPIHWKRHTPVLFPIVGGLKNNRYLYQNKSYSMNQHGFARDLEFKVIEQTETLINFELKQNNNTLKTYPFHFKLNIVYTLTDNKLKTQYLVNNSNDQELFFSIGGHPAFACPFEKDHLRDDYKIVFNTLDTPKSQLLKNGLRDNSYKNVFNDKKGSLSLSKDLFKDDALIFNPNPFNSASFIHKKSLKNYMTLEFNDFPFLGIWSKNETAPFVCIEPWHGIADHTNHSQNISQKEGIIKLNKFDSFNCEYTIITNS